MKVIDYSVNISDTETAWDVDASMNQILLEIRAKLRADMRENKLPATYTVKIERE